MKFAARWPCALSEPGSRFGGLCGAEEHAITTSTRMKMRMRFIVASIWRRWRAQQVDVRLAAARSRGCGAVRRRNYGGPHPFGSGWRSGSDTEAQQLGSQSPQVDVRPVRTRKEPEHRRPANAHARELGGRG